MKFLLASGLCAALSLGGAAHATTLTFDLNPSSGNGTPLGNYGDRVSGTNTDAQGTGGAAAGSYGIGAEGSTENVTFEVNRGGPGSDPRIWTSYSDLTNVVYEESDAGDPMNLVFTADLGFNVTLDSFDLGNFAQAITIPGLSIFADGLLALDLGAIALPASSQPHLSFDNLNVTGALVEIRVDRSGLGNPSDNIGFDNITFSQSAIAPVPLPASALLLIGGIGGLSLLRRRRKSA